MEKVFLVLGIASVALLGFILAKRGVFTGMSFSGSGTGSSTPSSGKKFNSAPLVGFLGRFAAYTAFVLFLGFLGSNYPDSPLGAIWSAWNKFFWFFWGSHCLMVVGIARYQYDLHSTRLIWLWIIFVPFGVLFIALGGNLKNMGNLFSTPAGGDPVAVMIDEKGSVTSHVTPFSKYIPRGFQIHCVEDIDVWVPNCQKSGGGSWNRYNPKNGYTDLPVAKYCGDTSELVYSFRRHKD